MLKKMLALFILAIACFSVFAQVVAPEKRNYAFEEVYDVFVPSGKSSIVYINIDGDIATGRVSFIQGKNPMVIPDEKGKLLEQDPKFKSVYCNLTYSGGEESRSFHLYGSVGIKSDEWRRVICSFKPRRSGKIRVSVCHNGNGRNWYDTKPLRTEYYYPNVGFANYAEFSAKNLPIDNFKLGGNGWGGGKLENFSSKLKAEMKNDFSAPGGKYLRTPFGFSRTLNVKGDNDGKITCVLIFYVRGDDIYNSKY